MLRILTVEDEEPIRNLIQMNLENAGYECVCAADGMIASDLLLEMHFDLILLDIMLPKVDGYELFEYIRQFNTPVIFLTAKGSLEERVKGLNLGAEDYIVKPFEIVELLARIDVVMRRYNKSSSSLSFGDLTVDCDNHIVRKNDTVIDLTPKEYKLLVLFLRNVNITLFKERIYELIWGMDFEEDSRTLNLHIQRLRKKTGLENCLKTVYKVGFRLEKEE
ncbi:MAG: response regulator transcription factor [Lachnospiraceae bacterium]|nr:response regulator transcription factor [Lachnospiraceae bacterium]